MLYALIVSIILLAIFAGGPIAIALLVFGAIVFAFAQNGPAVVRTFFSSLLPITVMVGDYRKKLIVEYPLTASFFEFHFAPRDPRDMFDGIENALSSDDVVEILKNRKVRRWLRWRFATRLVLPNETEDGYLFVDVGVSPERDVYSRLKAYDYRRVAVITVAQNEKLERHGG